MLYILILWTFYIFTIINIVQPKIGHLFAKPIDANLISLFNAIVVTYRAFSYDSDVLDDYLTDTLEFIIIYFCMDLVLYKQNVEYIFHHFIGILGFSIVLVFECFPYHTNILLVSELSTVFMHLRTITFLYRRPLNRLNLLFEILFVISFVWFRIYKSWFIITDVFLLIDNFSKVVYFLIALIGYVLQIYWLWKIVSMVRSKLVSFLQSIRNHTLYQEVLHVD